MLIEHVKDCIDGHKSRNVNTLRGLKSFNNLLIPIEEIIMSCRHAVNLNPV